MKRLLLLLATALLLQAVGFFFIAGAAGASEAALKGWEVYRWTDEACYGPQVHSEIRVATCYALVPGTNRLKTVAEIKKTPLKLADLKRKLAALKKGEELFWNAPTADFTVPAESASSLPGAADPVVAEAHRLGLKLTIGAPAPAVGTATAPKK